jgi:hypothetical protein
MVLCTCEQEHVLRNAARHVVRLIRVRCLKGFVKRPHTEDAHSLLDAPLNDGAFAARNVHRGVKERSNVL